MRNSNKNIIRIFAILSLSLLFILVVLWSMMIYTSLNKNLPWYEPCGMQFLAVLILSCPALIIIGCTQIVLAKALNTSIWTRILPFITCAGLALPILLEDGLGKTMQIIGTLFCAVSILGAVYLVVKDMKRITNNLKKTAQES